MRDGHRSDCKTCCCIAGKAARLADLDKARAKDKRSYQKHRSKRVEYTKRWYQANKELANERGKDYQRVSSWHISLAHRCKAVAKKKRLDFNLDGDFIQGLFAKQSGRCHWLGIEMQPSRETRNPLQPSVDRIDCSKGYTRDNVVLACQFANMGRSAMTAARFRQFIASLKTHFIDEAFALGDAPKLRLERAS